MCYCGNDDFYSNVFYYGNRFTYRRRSGERYCTDTSSGQKWSKILYAEIQNVKEKDLEASAGNGIPQYTIMGRFIKALGMENLPNAWNILWDNMSVVGVNAPTLPEFLEDSHKNRNVMSMKPGMIGLWQVQRKHFTKEKSDENYVDNWSLFMDLGIIVKSLKLFLLNKAR